MDTYQASGSKTICQLLAAAATSVGLSVHPLPLSEVEKPRRRAHEVVLPSVLITYLSLYLVAQPMPFGNAVSLRHFLLQLHVLLDLIQA